MYGLSILLASAFFYASYGIFSKIIGHSFGPFTQAWTRSLISLIFLLIFGLARKQFVKIKANHLGWFFLIAITSSLSIAPSFYSFVYLRLGTALFIQYAATAVTGYLMGYFLLKEKLTKINILALALVLFGLLLVYWGEINLNIDETIPFMAAIIAGSFFTAWYVMSKKINKYYSVFQISTFVYISAVVVNMLIAVVAKENFNSEFLSPVWAANIGYGIAGFLGILLCVYGLKFVEAHKAGIILLSEIPFGVIFGYSLFGEALSIMTIAGGLSIIIAIALPDLYQFFIKHRNRAQKITETRCPHLPRYFQS